MWECKFAFTNRPRVGNHCGGTGWLLAVAPYCKRNLTEKTRSICLAEVVAGDIDQVWTQALSCKAVTPAVTTKWNCLSEGLGFFSRREALLCILHEGRNDLSLHEVQNERNHAGWYHGARVN